MRNGLGDRLSATFLVQILLSASSPWHLLLPRNINWSIFWLLFFHLKLNPFLLWQLAPRKWQLWIPQPFDVAGTKKSNGVTDYFPLQLLISLSEHLMTPLGIWKGPHRSRVGIKVELNMSNLGCFPVAESFLRSLLQPPESWGGRLWWKALPTTSWQAHPEKCSWQSDSGHAALHHCQGMTESRDSSRGGTLPLAHGLPASPDSLGLDPSSTGSTILSLGPAQSGVGNHVATLALHPSSEKLTVLTQVKAPSPPLIMGQEAHAVLPLEYHCALWSPGCLVEPLHVGFKSLASLTFLRLTLQSNVSVFCEYCSWAWKFQSTWRLGCVTFSLNSASLQFSLPACFSFSFSVPPPSSNLSFSIIFLSTTQLQSLGCVWLFATPWTVARQAPLSMGFFRQEYWHGLPFLSPGNLPDPGVEPASSVSPALAHGFFTTELQGSPASFSGNK